MIVSLYLFVFMCDANDKRIKNDVKKQNTKTILSFPLRCAENNKTTNKLTRNFWIVRATQ